MHHGADYVFWSFGMNVWVSSWENLFMPYANNKGTDQPGHPRSLISTFVVCCLDRIIAMVSKSKVWGLKLVSVAEEAGLSYTWSQTLKTGFFMTWLIYNMAERSARMVWAVLHINHNFSWTHSRKSSPIYSYHGWFPCLQRLSFSELIYLNMSHMATKPVFGLCDQIRHKPTCTATEVS